MEKTLNFIIFASFFTVFLQFFSNYPALSTKLLFVCFVKAFSIFFIYPQYLGAFDGFLRKIPLFVLFLHKLCEKLSTVFFTFRGHPCLVHIFLKKGDYSALYICIFAKFLHISTFFDKIVVDNFHPSFSLFFLIFSTMLITFDNKKAASLMRSRLVFYRLYKPTKHPNDGIAVI